MAPALAGCLAGAPVQTAALDHGAAVEDVLAGLSPRLGDLAIVHEVLDVETAHGLVNVDLYRPEVPEGFQSPVILVASPYNNENGPLGGSKRGPDNWASLPLYEWIREELMPRGYAFAQMDILGTRNSGGCMGIMNQEEREATAAVVDFLGAQAWTNGKVGMIGKSYLGMSQLGAALENPDHLAAIVPIAPPTHDYAYHYYQGVPYALNHLTNVLYYGAFSLPPPDGDPATYAARYGERVPCAPEAIAGGAYTMGDYSERWQARDFRPLVPKVRPDIAMFYIAGHQDWNVKPDHVLGIYNEWPGPKVMLVGQWAHDYPNINNHDEDTYGEREDWYYTLHRWFDHWLLGLDTGVMDEAAVCPVQTQASDGAWRCLQAFPPLAESGDVVSNLTLHPHVEGRLAASPGEGTVRFGDAVGRGLHGFAMFTSEAFDNATRIVGTPMVTMRASTTSAWNAHLTVALAIEKKGELDEFDWGFQSLRHRAGLEKGEQVAPGAMYDVAFPLYPLDHVFEPGERLVVILRGTSEAPNGGILPNPEPGVITVDLAETSLTLPLAPLDRKFEPLTHADLPGSYHQED